MLGHVTQSALDKLFHRFKSIRRKREEELHRQLQQHKILQSPQQETPSTPHHLRPKPKKDTFSTKQQRRQQQRLKHLKEDDKPQETHHSSNLHHRAWSAVPIDGDGVWQHSLESHPDSDGVV